MSVCPCDQPTPLVLNIPAGLDALPRQLRSFPEVREALLRSLPSKPALEKWRARGQRDLGLMWLEMWAYVSDVLAFYDERVANETYLRTARLKPSLRRRRHRLPTVEQLQKARRVHRQAWRLRCTVRREGRRFDAPVNAVYGPIGGTLSRPGVPGCG